MYIFILYRTSVITLTPHLLPWRPLSEDGLNLHLQEGKEKKTKIKVSWMYEKVRQKCTLLLTPKWNDGVLEGEWRGQTVQSKRSAVWVWRVQHDAHTTQGHRLWSIFQTWGLVHLPMAASSSVRWLVWEVWLFSCICTALLYVYSSTVLVQFCCTSEFHCTCTVLLYTYNYIVLVRFYCTCTVILYL